MVVDRDSPEWPKEQIAAILRERIRSGEFRTRLPSQMTLAHDLNVSPTTIQRALQILKDEGLIYTVDGRGTFVR